MLPLTPGGQWGGQKALVWLLLPCPGVKRTVLPARQWTRLPWLSLTHRSPLSLGRPALWGRLAGGSGQMCEFQSLIPNDATGWWSQAGTAQRTLELRQCAHHTQVQAAGQTCSESPVRGNSKTWIGHPHARLESPTVLPLEPSGWVQVNRPWAVPLWLLSFCCCPSCVCFQQGPCARCPLSQWKETKWSSGAEESFSLWPKNGEEGAHAVKYMFSPKVLWWNCFIGFLSVGRGGGWTSCWSYLQTVLLRAQRLCTCPAITILNWAVV